MTVEAPPSGHSAAESPVVTPERQRLMEGLVTWVNPGNRFRIIDLEYVADAVKRRPEWAASARAGMPVQEWNREFGSQWLVYDGKPVYQDFDETIHVTRGKLIVPRRARLVSGWDAGPNDVNLAWVLAVTSPGLGKLQVIDEYLAEDGDIPDFLQTVNSRLMLEWVKLGGFSVHIADQSVFTESSIVPGKATAHLMRQFGMYPIPGEISFALRRRSVNELLTSFTPGINGQIVPNLMVHERCEAVIAGLAGGYQYGRATIGGNGTYKETPVKNKYSHLCNALEYIASRFHVAVDTRIPYEGRSLPAARDGF